MKHLIFSPVFLFIVLSNVSEAQSDQPLEMPQQVLDNLYSVSGQYVYEKPTLKISKDNRRVAAYIPKYNTISIDEKALEICMSMGQEAPNALSFIIGHELAHAFQKVVRTTNFLAYDKHYHDSLRTEKVADIQGVFTGYLAGYGMKKAIPEVLKNIYGAYNIEDDKLVNYPSFEERSASAKEVVAIVDDLVDLFEINEYLMALEQYKISIYCLEHILEYYQGREIHNNLGVAHLHTAMDIAFDPETDKYAYPLELDASSLLKKIDKSRGQATLSQAERKIRNAILSQGLEYFKNAIKLDGGYTIAKINKACTLNLLNKPGEAFKYLQSDSFSYQEKQDPAYKLANAITLALLGQKPEPLLQFNTLRNGKHKLAAIQAEYNYKIVKGIENVKHPKNAYTLPESILDYSNKLKISNTRTWQETKIANDLIFRKYKSQFKKSFSFGDGYRDYFSIVISTENIGRLPLDNNAARFSENFYHNLIVEKTGFFIRSENQATIVKSNGDGDILEIARYYK